MRQKGSNFKRLQISPVGMPLADGVKVPLVDSTSVCLTVLAYKRKEITMILKVWLAAAFLTVAAYYVVHAWGEMKEAVSIARHGPDQAKP
ncbi:hypothetical protein IE4803_CH03005 [Rhizobium etli bv. phaseoli str. IE4803]|nr:hypothetical protein IE4803_CH03005 [Rhizobium etli bv. phaseoli str. IE4803]